MKQGSGRTTRMLEEAKRLVKAGHIVYILTANAKHSKELQLKINREIPNSSIKCETVMPEFDWVEMRIRGSHTNCKVLVDHYTIESKFQNMLRMLVKFDYVIKPVRHKSKSLQDI